ncbi:MAG: hypothetical protein M3395_03540 [Chloroflexota bacterium]|nr:hypothetical protein [Chloroflexota bacterium]
MLLNLALWIGGSVLLAVGVMRIRGPLARYRELQATEANLRRYDSWRGGHRTAVDTGTTGADIMRAQLRSTAIRWGAVIAAGIALIVAGFVVR